MISSTKQPSVKLMKTLLRWLALGFLFAGTHAFAQTGGTVTYVYTDPQGTPLAETDASGNITATFDYTPYGTYAPNGTSAPGPNPNGPGYTGHVNDPETNLVYMQARYYDPATGQFPSADPVSITPGNVYSFSRYAYANNNPIINTDPTGKLPNDGLGGWQNETFRQDSQCSVCLQTSGGATSVSTLSPVIVHPGDAAPAGGEQNARSNAGFFDGFFSVFFGTAYNEAKRPNNPTRVPDTFSHELFMTNATGVAVAAAPSAGILVAGATPVAADGSVVVAGVARNAAFRLGANSGNLLRAGALAASLHVSDPADTEAWGPITDVVERLGAYEEVTQRTSEAAEEAAGAQEQLPTH